MRRASGSYFRGIGIVKGNPVGNGGPVRSPAPVPAGKVGCGKPVGSPVPPPPMGKLKGAVIVGDGK